MTEDLKTEPIEEPTIKEKAESQLSQRQQAYWNTFTGDKNIFGKKVLDDLASFCRANQSTFHPDQRVHAVLEGRREVWLRIQEHLTLSLDELVKLYIKER